PELKLIAAHLGGYSEWDRAMEYLVGQDIWLDTSSSIRFIGPEKARLLVEAHGTDRVLFASDYPGDTQRQAVKEVLSMGLSEEDNEKIFWRNAERLLGIRI
ncbi:MAG: amidohydrolase family protein, partial [Lentisphaeria bacterium]|nr:amidohydrolase family protein [Lentisphaeria bacterium]